MNLEIYHPWTSTPSNVRYNSNGGLIRCVINRDGSNLMNQMEMEFIVEKVRNIPISLFTLFQWADAPNNYHKNIYIAISVKRTAKRIIVIAEELCRYTLRKCAVMPFEYTGSFPYILGEIHRNLIPHLPSDNIVDYSTVINSSRVYRAEGTMSTKIPCRFLELLKGMEGSVADNFGARIVLTSAYGNNSASIKITFDDFSDNISDTVVAGRDLEEWESNADSEDYQNNIIGYWRGTENDEETVVTASRIGFWTPEYYADVTSILDCSSMFKEKPEPSDIDKKIVSYSTDRRRSWNDNNYSIKLRDGYNYKAGDETVKRSIDAKIGNLIRVEIRENTNFVARVTATEYDCMMERYTSITLGEKLDSFSRMLAKDIKK